MFNESKEEYSVYQYPMGIFIAIYFTPAGKEGILFTGCSARFSVEPALSGALIGKNENHHHSQQLMHREGKPRWQLPVCGWFFLVFLKKVTRNQAQIALGKWFSETKRENLSPSRFRCLLKCALFVFHDKLGFVFKLM